MSRHQHSDLHTTQSLVYTPCGLQYSQLEMEPEGAEYGACMFAVNGRKVCFRVAKTTPTKVGQFVTLWKRIGKGPIQPFDMRDPIDLFVICVRKGERLGQFVFPKALLIRQDVVSVDGKGGKRAIRVYAPWEQDLNRQAQKTQHWQRQYFLEIPGNRPIDVTQAKQFYLPS